MVIIPVIPKIVTYIDKIIESPKIVTTPGTATVANLLLMIIPDTCLLLCVSESVLQNHWLVVA